jgi:hypothetical protein
MTEWSPDAPHLAKWIGKAETRRQNRVADFVQPHLEPDEHLVAVFSSVIETLPRKKERVVALVVTNHRLFVIRIGGLRSRPKNILMTYAHEGVNADSNRTARKVPMPYGSPMWEGKLSVTGSFGTKEFWVSTAMRDSAHAIAQTLGSGPASG